MEKDGGGGKETNFQLVSIGGNRHPLRRRWDARKQSVHRYHLLMSVGDSDQEKEEKEEKDEGRR